MVGINPLPEHLILKYQSVVGRSSSNHAELKLDKTREGKKSLFKVWRGDWQGGEAGVLFLSSLLRISTWIKHKSRSQRINSLLLSPTFEIFSICATHKKVLIRLGMICADWCSRQYLNNILYFFAHLQEVIIWEQALVMFWLFS